MLVLPSIAPSIILRRTRTTNVALFTLVFALVSCEEISVVSTCFGGTVATLLLWFGATMEIVGAKILLVRDAALG